MPVFCGNCFSTRVLKGVATILFLLIAITTIQIIQYPSTGNELSIYGSLPSTVWIFLVVSIVSGVSIVVYYVSRPGQKEGSLWPIGLLLILLSNPPSLVELFPFSILESMAAEKPVVATQVGGVPEMVIHEKTGLLVDPADSSALAEAVLTFARDKDLAKEMGVEGRRLLERRFTLEKTASQVNIPGLKPGAFNGCPCRLHE